MTPVIKIKRAYEEPSDYDGYRILVDRLWPRGISKEVLHVAAWAKEIAPTASLRTWYGHKPERWEAFQKSYLAELKENTAVKDFINTLKTHPVITLVYAAKDEQRTHALVLQRFLEKKFN